MEEPRKPSEDQHANGVGEPPQKKTRSEEAVPFASTNGSGGNKAEAVASEDDVKFVNEIELDLKASLIGHRRGVAFLAFSPDGKQLASCSAES